MAQESSFVGTLKLDILLRGTMCLSRLVSQLRPWPPMPLVEDVRTPQAATTCLDLSFSFFQGIYSGRPEAMQE